MSYTLTTLTVSYCAVPCPDLKWFTNGVLAKLLSRIRIQITTQISDSNHQHCTISRPESGCNNVIEWINGTVIRPTTAPKTASTRLLSSEAIQASTPGYVARRNAHYHHRRRQHTYLGLHHLRTKPWIFDECEVISQHQ